MHLQEALQNEEHVCKPIHCTISNQLELRSTIGQEIKIKTQESSNKFQHHSSLKQFKNYNVVCTMYKSFLKELEFGNNLVGAILTISKVEKDLNMERTLGRLVINLTKNRATPTISLTQGNLAISSTRRSKQWAAQGVQKIWG